MRKENLFNIDPCNVKPYTLLSKILYMSEVQQKILKNELLSLDERRRDILMYMDYYLSDHNLETDTYLNGLIHSYNDNGYVGIFEFLKFNKMRERGVTNKDIQFIAPYAENFEIDEQGIKLRKKVKSVN